MSNEFYIIVSLIVAGFAVLAWLVARKKDKSQDQSLLMLQNQINEITKTLDVKLGESTKMLQSQFGQSAKIIANVTERLTKLDETNKQVVNFADQLKNLQDILKNPKQRGVLGEYYLETVLKNVLPPDAYKMQYNLGLDDDSGSKLIPDAVVFVKDKIIPIDAKFSLENYNRLIETNNQEEKERLEKKFVNDLKERIKETAKYIKPSLRTMDFAFMFIPHEAIYYDLLINKVGAIEGSQENLIHRAASKYHVVIVSPTSFLAYLQTVLQGLRALQIEESAKEIRKNVEALQKHLLNYDNYMQKMGAHLSTVVNTYTVGYKEFKKINKDVTKITGKSGEIEVLEIAKPKTED